MNRESKVNIHYKASSKKMGSRIEKARLNRLIDKMISFSFKLFSHLGSTIFYNSKLNHPKRCIWVNCLDSHISLNPIQVSLT